MDFNYIALVSETDNVSVSDVCIASAALQKQVMRDFAPVWEQNGTVDPFVKLEDVPLGYWPIMIRDDIGFAGAAGIHLDEDGQPFGLVQFSKSWQLTASHEILEMLGDPFGNRVIAGQSIKPGQNRVDYLVEVCDPSEAAQFGYNVNNIRVSDFYTPHFFDPVKASGVRYSFTSAITKPRDVLKGGYLSWHDPVSNHWWQQVFFGAKKQFRDLGIITGSAVNIRSEIDRRTEVKEKIHGYKLEAKPATGGRRAAALMAAAAAAGSGGGAKADRWRAQVQVLKQQYGPQA